MGDIQGGRGFIHIGVVLEVEKARRLKAQMFIPYYNTSLMPPENLLPDGNNILKPYHSKLT